MTSLQSKARPPCRVPDQSRDARQPPGWGGGAGRRADEEWKGERGGGNLREAVTVEKADTLGSFDSLPFGDPPPSGLLPPSPASLPHRLPLGRGGKLRMGAASALLLRVPAEPQTSEGFGGSMT